MDEMCELWSNLVNFGLFFWMWDVLEVNVDNYVEKLEDEVLIFGLVYWIFDYFCECG